MRLNYGVYMWSRCIQVVPGTYTGTCTNLYVCMNVQVYSGTGIFLCIVVYFIILNYILFLF